MYYLYKFINVETRYNIYNKELYAIIKALKYQRIYAYSYLELIIFTDYKNLLQFIIIKELILR